jgi:hypothetical protein
MTVSNKELYSLYSSVKTSHDNGIYGLYIEGFSGGVTAYATDGNAAYRKTFCGDNKEVFTAYYKGWNKKDGVTYSGNLQYGEKDDRNMVQAMKDYFEAERFNSFTVNYGEFKKAVRGVSAIHRGESGCAKKDIALSIHGGNLDIASWNDNGDTSLWQVEGFYPGSGAVCVSKKYLDGIKADKTIEFSYSKTQGKTVLCVHGDNEAIIVSQGFDKAMFTEVLGYEPCEPEKAVKPELKPAITEKPQEQPVKQTEKPVRKTSRLKRLKTKLNLWQVRTYSSLTIAESWLIENRGG